MLKKGILVILGLSLLAFLTYNGADREEGDETIGFGTRFVGSEQKERNVLVEMDCVNLVDASPTSDFARAMKALSSKNRGDELRCHYLKDKSVSVYISNASPELQRSPCFDSYGDSGRGTYTFKAPALLYLTITVRGEADYYDNVYVFMEKLQPLSRFAWLNYNEHERNRILISVCPPVGQTWFADRNSWELIPMAVNFGMAGLYEDVFSELLGGVSVITRHHFGFDGVHAIEELYREMK